MQRRLNQIIVSLIMLTLFFGLRLADAAGLSTGFSEVTLEGLSIGATYSTKEKANLPLVIVNTGEEAVDLKIELLLPEPQEIKKGFLPIPELSWIKLEETEFRGIKPKESAVTDVIISIPDDKQYRGKNYQVFLWSHTIGKMVGVGLKSKLLLKIKDE